MRRFGKLVLILILGYSTTPLSGAQIIPSRNDSALSGYVFLSLENQARAKGIEIRITSATKVPLCTFSTEENGRFQRLVHRSMGQVSVSGCVPFPGNLPVFFYIKIEGYGELFQEWAKDAGNVLELLPGPNDGLDVTHRELPPLTPEESRRKELVDAYGEEAVRYYEAALADKVKHTDKAINYLNKAVKAAPKFYEAYVELGSLLHQSRQLHGAEQALRKAIALKPNAGEPGIELGEVLFDRASGLVAAGSVDAANTVFTDATGILKEALQKAPWSSAGWYYLGSAHYQLNQLADAEASLRKALAQDDPRQDARLILANIYVKEKRYPEALNQLDAYLAAVPSGPQHAAAVELKATVQREIKAP
jgi:tetratricopeptide (TPR) repeat protein